MSQFRLNGEVRNLEAPSLAALIEREGLGQETALAVALNDHVVRRESWKDTMLKPGDAVEIVKPFSGG